MSLIDIPEVNAQARLSAILTDWAGERGEVGTEWRCDFFPIADATTSLVPDVAYFSFERLPVALREGREQPTIAPDIAVEIISPEDSLGRLREKIALYFAFGSRTVIVADPANAMLTIHDAVDDTKSYRRGDIPLITAYPDLHIDLGKLFRNLG